MVGLYPRRKVLGGEQMGLLILPVLTPALLVGIGLCVLRETCKQVGMGCGDEFGRESLRNRRNQLQERETGIDVRGALA